jgi:DnaJ-class molecular chaperone
MVTSHKIKDPYEILEVKRTATVDEIRTAYRRLAKLHHPDLNPGKADAEAAFKELTAANALLSDPEQRARFDRGEIDASGNERASERDFYRDFGDDTRRTKYRSDQRYRPRQGNGTGEGFDAADLEDIFAQAFADHDARRYTTPGADAHFSLRISFLDAVNGTTNRVSLPDGRTLDVVVPAGVKDGQVLRLRGQGMPGHGRTAAESTLKGDALITITIAPHAFFRRDGNDVLLELPVALKEALLGAKVEVPTPKGPVGLHIPPNSSSGTKLRLKGRGIAGGHQYVTLKLVLPAETEPELAQFLENWIPIHPFDPRKSMVAP